MNLNYLLMALMVGFVACQQSTPEASPKNLPIPAAGLASYQPAEFSEDRRAEKLAALGPKLKQLFQDHAEARHIPGIAYGIVVDNELVLADAIGTINLDKELPASPKSVFRIASMTKSFTAMAIMQLRDAGKLSLEDPAASYIPEMRELPYLTLDAPLIDIENLLTMTAGFPEDNPWGDRQLDEPDQMLQDLMSEGVSFSNPPSYAFEYSNTGYALLGLIITRVSGMPYQTYITENILQPLGMEDTYWEYEEVPEVELAIGYRWEGEEWKLEPMLHDGSYGAMGGLLTTIEDFGKYVSFHLAAWPPRNDPEGGPVKRSSLREMHTPQYSRLIAEARDWHDEPCPVINGYGYGLGIMESCKGVKRVSHGGALPGFGSNYVFYPEYGVGMMAFCNLTYTTPWPYVDLLKLVFDSVQVEPRRLPPSDILVERQSAIARWVQLQDPEQEKELFAENFFLDKSRESRLAELEKIMAEIGDVERLGDIEPSNQLRGSFELHGEKGIANVFFTLSPEKDPKVQYLYMTVKEEE